jgi:TfoX/Sxy family transcriptional regulator of competence genes
VPYDLKLAERIRKEIDREANLEEKKMFGGVGYLIDGNMACGVHGGDLIVRVGPEKYEAGLAQPHTRPFDMTGRPMAGWIMVAPQDCALDVDLKDWIAQGVALARSLPPK